METITQRLTAFARKTALEDVPAHVIHQAKRTLLNFFGCACGGAHHPSVDAVIRGKGPWSGRPVAAIIGRSESFDPGLAALINGMSSAVYSFDDTHADTLAHPGGPVASSLLALTPIRATRGSEFLLSFIIGAELVCRLSKSISTPPARVRQEWVQTGICAGLGAAVACAKLLQLSEREIASAMAIAEARASGLRALSRSMCFSYMAGSAAEAGAVSAILAQAGMIGAEEPIAGEHGFCAAFSVEPHIEYLTAELGERFELEANTFKPYPCGVVIHPIIDASLALAKEIADPMEIEQILVVVHPSTARLADIRDPKDQFEAQVSMQHWTACAFLDRVASIEQTSDERLQSSSVAAMRGRVRIQSDPEMPRAGGRVEVRLQSGRMLSETVEECRGSSRRPLSDEELEAKYFNQAIPTLGAQVARRLAEACWETDRLPNALALMQLATATPG